MDMLKVFKKPEIIVNGIAAYDKYFTVDEKFSHYISSLKKISVGIPVYFLRNDFGGSGANIAYALKKSGVETMLWTYAGSDFESYIGQLNKNKISYYLIEDGNRYSAECVFYIDKSDNKISFFNNGALESGKKIDRRSVENKIDWSRVKFGIIAPNLAKNSLDFHNFLKGRRIKYIFDPGVKIFDFTFGEFEKIDRGAFVTILNEEEVLAYKNIYKKDIIRTTGSEYLIVTQGVKGVSVYRKGELFCKKGIVKAKKVVNTVGCGDAFRGGFVKGLISGGELDKALDYGLKLASIQAASVGTQNF